MSTEQMLALVKEAMQEACLEAITCQEMLDWLRANKPETISERLHASGEACVLAL